MTPKTAPWFVHYGCVPGLYPDSTLLLTAFMLKPTQTPFIAGPLALMRIDTARKLVSLFPTIKTMPRILIITTFLLFSLELTSQTEKRFEYTQMGSSYLATPIFDQTKPEGKEGRATWSDDKYMQDFLNNTLEKILSKEKRDSLHLGSAILFTFNSNGDIINCKFFVSYKDTTLISEDDLYNLYLRFKKIRFDMAKVKIVPNYNTEWKYGDYAVIIGSMISKESRDKLNKKY